MKKILIGALVGGIIIFIWQTLSWTILDLHRPAQEYTPKQDTIMAFLNKQFTESGSYFLPNCPTGSSSEKMEKAMADAMGKPWMMIQYHKTMDMNMGMNITRGLITTIFMVGLFCWILMQFKSDVSFFTIFLATLLTGFIVYINVPYTGSIWYQWADIRSYLIDTTVSWGACGLWLGWWMRKK